MNRNLSTNPTLVGTSRCDVSARALAGGTNTTRRAGNPLVAPLDAARTAQRAVPTRFKGSKREISFGRIFPMTYYTGSWLALAIAIAVGLCSLTTDAPAQQPARPATLQEALTQIEALKKQMNDLEKFIRDQAQQQGVTPPAPTPAPPPTAGAEAPPDSGFVKWNELVTGKSKFKLYGFLRGDMIYDDSRPGGNGANSSLVPAFILSENGYGGAANLAPSRNHENILFHPRLSRVGMDFTGPTIDALW